MKYISLLLVIVIMGSCNSQKIDNTLSSFEEGYQPYAQSWTGGIPGSGSGINLFLPLDTTVMQQMEAVYFKGMITQTFDIKDPNGYIIARFKTDFNNKPDMNMNLEYEEEYGNKPPANQKFPFELEDSEAVVKFSRDGKTTYTLITGIQTRPSMDLPSRPQ
ncbi:hypothetical protein [Nonlabens agnitus]|uniref:Uncharacterized protein n=1 Tax=Nonlabens agnitus TaxID=870484 RepID=A0A2S9WW25_9FLAO|nr:hypothetical protein [Nonlabens agnitus]PRP67678.1 hypothetical protein BST86_11540 [Nonlabens agnitus]